jgi:hypothetical protein
MHHVQSHLLQMGSPALKDAMASGKAHPDTAKNLQLMTEQAIAKIRTFAKDPMGMTEAKKMSVLGRPQ